MKRMTNFKKKKVQAISDFPLCVGIILRHFQLSRIGQKLKKVLEMMEVKPIHMIIFCPTSMFGIFSATTQSVKIMVPICDFVTSADTKKRATGSVYVPQRSGS